MAQGGSLKFVVEVAANQATDALNVISQAVNQAGVKTKLTMLDIANSTRGASREMTGLAGAIQKFKSEQVQQGRLVGFYVREIADLAGAGKEAAGVLQGVGGVLAELAGGLTKGALIGAGIEGVKLLVGLVRDYAEESERAATAWKDANASIASFSSQAEDQLNGMLLKARGFSEAMISAVRAMQQAKTIKLPTGEEVSANEAQVIAGERINDLRSRFAYAKSHMGVAAAGMSDSEAAAIYGNLGKLQAEIGKWEELRQKIVEADSKLREVAQTVDRTNAKNKAAADAVRTQADADRALSEHQKTGQAALDARARAFEAAKKKGEELHEWMRQFYSDVDNWEREDAAKKKKAAEEFAEWKRQFNAQVADWEREDARKQAQAFADGYVRPVVGTFTNGLSQMMQGQMTFRDFMRSMWSEIVGLIINSLGQMLTTWIVSKLTEKVIEKTTAISEINANAGVAGSAAAAAVAGIPVVGPAMAPAAMAAVSSAVLGSMLPLASAAGGWQTPLSGGPFPAVLHTEEKVLNTRQSRTYDRVADALERGGRGGGSGVTINASFPSLDPATAARGFVRNEREIARTVKRAARRAGV